MTSSERFQRALKDLKDVFGSKGLAQDATAKEHIKTQMALVSNVYRIGREDGMNDNEIKRF
jgi:hypothetical protein